MRLMKNLLQRALMDEVTRIPSPWTLAYRKGSGRGQWTSSFSFIKIWLVHIHVFCILFQNIFKYLVSHFTILRYIGILGAKLRVYWDPTPPPPLAGPENTASHLLMGLKRSDHVTLILTCTGFQLKKGIEFKIVLITYKTIYGRSADYLKPLIEMYPPSRTLRSASRSLLCPKKAKTENFGCTAFFFWGTEIVELPTGGH